MMYPIRRIEHIEDLMSDARSSRTATRSKIRPELRARVCPLALAVSDLAAFMLAISIGGLVTITPASVRSPFAQAFENLNALGVAWHGWGSLLVLTCLFGYFGCRGH